MSRTIPLGLLEQVRIASPCPARWEDMTGDDRVRRCSLCSLDVHNISALSRDEAEAFLQQREELKARGERVCIIFHRRADGTLITRDCPIGLAAIHSRTKRAALLIASLFLALIGVLASLSTLDRRAWYAGARARYLDPFTRVRQAINPPPPRVYVGF